MCPKGWPTKETLLPEYERLLEKIRGATGNEDQAGGAVWSHSHCSFAARTMKAVGFSPRAASF